MKKSIISIITAFLLVLGSVLPVFAAENNVTLTVSTDKSDYVPGDTIHVNGKVLKNGAAGKGTNPTLKFIDPNGKRIQSEQFDVIGSDGSFTYNIVLGSNIMNGSYTIQVSATDAATQTTKVNVSGATAVKTLSVKDLKENYKPGDKVDISGSVLFGSQGVNGNDITINILKNNKDLSGSPLKIKSDASGSFASSYTLPKDAVAGTYTVKVAASGVDQPVSKNFTVSTNTTDPGTGGPGSGTDPGSGSGTIPPPVPVPDLKEGPVLNPVTSEDLEISGTSESGTSVYITDKKDLKLTSLISANKSFSIKLSQKVKEGTTLYATALDENGKIISKETAFVVVDKTPPAAPIVNSVKDYDKVVTGKAEPNAKIGVSVGNTQLASSTVGSDGKFSIRINAQKAGTKLAVTVTDATGNVSAPTYVIVIDKTAPKAPSVNSVSNRDKKLTGKTEAGAKVTIKVGKKTLGSKTADKKGNFSVSIKAQKAGTKLEVTVTDKAGNISKATKVTVKDKTPPSVPTVSKVKPTSTKITGKAEAGAKVYVKAGKKIIGSATASKKGSYSVKIKKQKRGTNLYVYAKDKAGNVGKSKKVTVK